MCPEIAHGTAVVVTAITVSEGPFPWSDITPVAAFNVDELVMVGLFFLPSGSVVLASVWCQQVVVVFLSLFFFHCTQGSLTCVVN